MKIVRIFASEDLENKGGLLAIRYKKGEKDAYERNFDFWFDATEVIKYLQANEWYLTDDYFKKQNKSIDELQEQIEKEANDLHDFFLDLENSNFEGNISLLEHIFKPLNNRESYGTELQKSKSPDDKRRPLIRLYAIRIHKNLFIVTGGAIKLTGQMGEHDDTDKELEKLEIVRDFLKANGLTTANDLIYYYENNE